MLRRGQRPSDGDAGLSSAVICQYMETFVLFEENRSLPGWVGHRSGIGLHMLHLAYAFAVPNQRLELPRP